MHLTFLFEIGRMGQVTKNIRICLTIFTFYILHFLLFLTQVQILWKEAALAWHECSANKNRNFYLWVSCFLLAAFYLYFVKASDIKFEKMSQLIFLLLAFLKLTEFTYNQQFFLFLSLFLSFFHFSLSLSKWSYVYKFVSFLLSRGGMQKM